VLAVVTAVIDARGANHVVSVHALAAYRPALDVIAGIAVAGVAIALTGLRPPSPAPAGVTAAPARVTVAGVAAAGTEDCDDAEFEPARS
jgi:hypothetical protein